MFPKLAYLKESPGATQHSQVLSLEVLILRRAPSIRVFNTFPGGTYDQAALFNTDLDSKHRLKLSCVSLEQRLEIILAKTPP